MIRSLIRWLIHRCFGTSAHHRQVNEMNITRLRADLARRNAMQLKVDVITHKGGHSH